jgi:hypothetical protein
MKVTHRALYEIRASVKPQGVDLQSLFLREGEEEAFVIASNGSFEEVARHAAELASNGL